MPAVGIDRLEYVMDMQEKIIYMKTPKDQLQYIYYHDCRQSYPRHTHASHIVIGCALEGAVAVAFLCRKSMQKLSSGRFERPVIKCFK